MFDIFVDLAARFRPYRVSARIIPIIQVFGDPKIPVAANHNMVVINFAKNGKSIVLEEIGIIALSWGINSYY